VGALVVAVAVLLARPLVRTGAQQACR
jgi:hypothetical protein